jgi:diacylglycerol O-acyltransferase
VGTTRPPSTHRDLRVDRLSANDLTMLVTDRGPAPMNIAAVLVVDDGDRLGAQEVVRLLGERVRSVHRLRERVQKAPPGCGRPYWVPDERFDVRRHVHAHAVDGMQGLLDLAASEACRQLARDRPLWSAHWVTGVGGGRAALVIVAHHVLADGIGGLAVLAALADPPDAARVRAVAPPGAPPRTAARPSTRDLVADAWRTRLDGLRQARRRVRLGARGLRDLGIGSQPPGRIARTSLNRPTGPRRVLSTVEVPLAHTVDAAHRHGCTVNDVVVSAVVAAMSDVLAARGEHIDPVVVSVPYSSRRTASSSDLGNENGVVRFRVPGTGADPLDRLRHVAAQSRVQRTGPRGASAGPLGAVFRVLARMGVFQWFIDHQRLVHTFVTNVRGPADPLRFGGCDVSRVLPVSVVPGNAAVAFDVLSYAGSLGITVVADPDTLPDASPLTGRLTTRLEELVEPSTAAGGRS